MQKVVVGLSGGVDSSVSAYLLQKQGYEVIGLFMKNWHDESVTISSECPWLEDSNDAMIIAEKLGIPYQTIDLSATYKERIVNYMFSEYENGRTPNPDILCNREIKFDVFLDIALSLGADYVATGHYCQKTEVEKGNETFFNLLMGKDANKDQSYFLCQLTQKQLAKALFPIGHLTKPEVRKIAEEQKLITANKKDSQGLCFIGKVKLPDFLKQKLKPKEGSIIEIPSTHNAYHLFPKEFNSMEETLQSLSNKYTYVQQQGEIKGKHQGAHFFTIGQRKGLSVGGTQEPLFVIETDVKENIVYVGQGKEHPGLFRKALFIQNKDIHWIRPDLKLKEGEQANFHVRIRYRQPLQEAQLLQYANGLFILFNQPQSAITSGQFAAWYEGEKLIGSGVIA